MKNVMRIAIALLLWANACVADEGGNAAPEMMVTAVSLEDAANQLGKDGQNRVLGAETEQMDDKIVYVIKVLTGQGHILHYKVDAETGQLLN
ncbi:MAG: PepSY domain-containing protein [Methylovulum sp.]|nr:PepSY domain-containing protein [Methylovulum sp.]